ncbi:caspase family protein [Larkinella arboricola]
MAKRAVVVGIDNYTIFDPSGNNNLFNCVNSARSMYHLLRDVFGFTEIYYYEDLKATRSRILLALRHVLSISEAGDSVCFYYAGHGTRQRADFAQPDCDLYYEALVPAAQGVITDRDLSDLTVNLYPDAVNFTVITDSCFSGGLHVGDSTVKCPSLPLAIDLLEAISTFMKTLIPCGICLTSPSEMSNNVSNVRVTSDNTIDLDPDLNKTLVASCKSTLLSSCRFDEVSWITSKYSHMIFTQSLLELVNQSNFEASYHSVADQVRQKVSEKIISDILPGHPGITQTPQLFGQRNRMEENWLAGWTFTPANP